VDKIHTRSRAQPLRLVGGAPCTGQQHICMHCTHRLGPFLFFSLPPCPGLLVRLRLLAASSATRTCRQHASTVHCGLWSPLPHARRRRMTGGKSESETEPSREILNIYKLINICVIGQLDVVVVWPVSCWTSIDQPGA
jgi:hypothetical protein